MHYLSTSVPVHGMSGPDHAGEVEQGAGCQAAGVGHGAGALLEGHWHHPGPPPRRLSGQVRYNDHNTGRFLYDACLGYHKSGPHMRVLLWQGVLPLRHMHLCPRSWWLYQNYTEALCNMHVVYRDSVSNPESGSCFWTPAVDMFSLPIESCQVPQTP